MGMALMKALTCGEEFQPDSPAAIFALYTQWSPVILPDSFNPLILFTKGFSAVTGHSETDRSLQALLFGEDWLKYCRDAGADTKNAIICLASNFDEHIGVVAMALELAMIATKPKTPDSVRLDKESYMAVFGEVFVKNYGGVHGVGEKWGVGIKEGAVIPNKRTRLTWTEELGYDVLIHPKTLEPCRHADGTPLFYHGVDENGLFWLTHPSTREVVRSGAFPPA